MNFRLSVTLCAQLLLPCFVFCAPPDQVEAIRDFVAANGAVERWYARKRVFANASEASIADLLFHENNGVAITAAWERALKGELITVRAGMPELGSTFPKFSIQRFLGLVEGRIKCPIPKGWAKVVEKSVVFQDGAVVPNLSPIENSFYSDTEGFLLLKSQSIRRTNNEWHLHIDKKHCVIPRGVFDKDQLAMGVYGTIHNDVCIQFFPAMNGSSQIICVEQRSGKTAWRAKVWGSMSGGGFSGIPAKHLAILSIHKSAVYVFGADGGGAVYLEAFRIADGEPVLRFSSAY